MPSSSMAPFATGGNDDKTASALSEHALSCHRGRTHGHGELCHRLHAFLLLPQNANDHVELDRGLCLFLPLFALLGGQSPLLSGKRPGKPSLLTRWGKFLLSY